MNSTSRWDDFSDHLAHFTKGFDGKSAYENQLSILSKQRVEARYAYGISRRDGVLSREAVCFSEVPIHELRRIAKSRSRYGIGFRKQFVLRAGGNPIWYVEKDSELHGSLRALKDRALADSSSESEFWKIAPFIDVPGEYGQSIYRFEWEREWRCVSHLDFTTDDVAFLAIPEELHDDARRFFFDAYEEDTGPSYDCPFIDPYWSKVRVEQAFCEIATKVI